MDLQDIKGRIAALNEDNAKDKINEYIDVEEIEELVDLLSLFKNTLIFYATESTYQHDKWGSPIERDYGKLAIKTLNKLK